MEMNMGRRMRGAGQQRRRLFLACAFAVAAIYEPAFVGAAVVIGGESSSSTSSSWAKMLLRGSTAASEEEDEGNIATEEMYEEHNDEHHRSLWLKEFLANYLQRKQTSSPSSTMVIVSAPLTSQKPTSSNPTTSEPTTSSPTYSVHVVTGTPTKSPTLAVVGPATAKPTATPEYWFYPVQYGGFRVCIAAKPYPANTELFADDCACCKNHGCDSDVSHCGEISTPVATLTPSAETITTSPTMSMHVSSKPVSSKPTSHKPTTSKPAMSKISTSKPTTSKPTSTKPTLPEPPDETEIPTYSLTMDTEIPTYSPTYEVTEVLSNTPMWLYYPVKFDNEMWCVFGDHNDATFLKRMPPASNETYKTKCECCSKDYHFCVDSVKQECAASVVTEAPTSSLTIVIVDPTTINPTNGKTVTGTPTNIVAIDSQSASPSRAPVTESTSSSPINPSPSKSPSNEPALTASPSKDPNTLISGYYFYPAHFGDNTFCLHGHSAMIPALVGLTPTEQVDYVSSTMCECCSKNVCAIAPDTCPTALTKTTTTTTTVVVTGTPTKSPTIAVVGPATAKPTATPEYWFYPVQYGGFRVCIAAKPYPANTELFADDCACCKQHGCDSDVSHCGEISTPVATPTPPR